MRIAVTGADGRLGGQVVRLLAAPGAHEVVGLARREMPRLPHVSWVRTDYADLPALGAALRGVDTLSDEVRRLTGRSPASVREVLAQLT